MMQANEQGNYVEVLKVKKIIMHGPQRKLGFFKLWDFTLLYCVILDKIEYTRTVDTCGFEYRHGYSIRASEGR